MAGRVCILWRFTLLISCLAIAVSAQVKVACASENTCVILSTGATKCFGAGGYNGNGNSNDVGNTPNSMGFNLSAITWGSNLSISQVFQGGNFDNAATTCGILYNNSNPTVLEAKCFGYNNYAVTGRGIDQTQVPIFGDEPGQMTTNFTAVNLGTGLMPSKVVVGLEHACAIVSSADLSVDGKVKCWGRGANGALGNNDVFQNEGQTPSGMGDNLPFMNISSRVIDIAAGLEFTCVIVAPSGTSGDVYCTGNGQNGATGQGNSNIIEIPTFVDLGVGITASKIVAGDLHVCVIIQPSQQMKCWGNGFYHQLGTVSLNNIGDEPNEMGDNLTALNFGLQYFVSDIAAGASFTCALFTNSQLKCFGDNSLTQLGYGDTCNRPSSGSACPTTLQTLPAVNLGTGIIPTQVALGAGHACSIVTSTTFTGSRMKCWGRAQNGETGQETTEISSMGDELPFTDVGEPTSSPTSSPSTSAPSHSPSKSPSTSKPSSRPSTSVPSRSPVTTRPSHAPTNHPSASPITRSPTSLTPTTLHPSKAPTRLPTHQPSYSPTPKKTNSPTTASPTAPSIATPVGAAIGGIVGCTSIALAAFVVYRRRHDIVKLGGASNNKPSSTWLAQVNFSEKPSTAYPVTGKPTATASKYSAAAVSYESGNPVYTGLRLSASGAGSAKPTTEQIREKLSVFYSRVDPNKDANDIKDLADWATVHGEEALYIKLRKKYGADPNTFIKRAKGPKLLFSDEVDV